MVVPAREEIIGSDEFSLDGSLFAKLKGREKCLIRSQNFLFVSFLREASGFEGDGKTFCFFLHLYTQIFILSISGLESHHK